MLEKLLKQLDLFSKTYFKEYELSDDKLILQTSANVSEAMAFGEVVEISEKINSNLFDYTYADRKIEIILKPVYQQITDEVKSAMQTLNAVFPSEYSELFIEKAMKNDIELNPEDLSSELLDDRVLEHANNLSRYANNAIVAMKDRNEFGLNVVLDDTESLLREIEELKSSLYEDALTKVYNRKWMDDHYFDRDGEKFIKKGTLAVVDMNDFKYINDTFGHIHGDKVLVYIANQLKRSGGNIVRYGGDEFFVFFDDRESVENAHKKMHKIRELVIRKVLKTGGFNFKTSFSYGLASFEKGDNAVSGIASADAEMYRDKAAVKKRLEKMR